MLQDCGHNFRKSRGDSHPLCWACSEELGIELCSPQNTCWICADFAKDTWKRILDARRKRPKSSKSPIAQRIMFDAQESKIPLGMGETVPQDETGDPHHSDSDSSVPCHREDLEQSRDDLEGDMDPSQKHTRRDMTQRRKGSVTPTYFSTAGEIEIPDLLRWVAKNSALKRARHLQSRRKKSFSYSNPNMCLPGQDRISLHSSPLRPYSVWVRSRLLRPSKGRRTEAWLWGAFPLRQCARSTLNNTNCQDRT